MSGAKSPAYRRLVLELALGPVDRSVIRFAAEFAHEMGLDLHGLYIEDESLHHLAAFPFAREIRLPTHEWRTLNAGSLSEELRHTAELAHQQLREVMEGFGMRDTFEIRRGRPDACVAGYCSASDIFVIVEPETRDPVRWPAVEALQQAAARSAASVLVLPHRLSHRHGFVSVVTEALNDPAVTIAARLAQAYRTRLLVITSDTGGGDVIDLPDDRIDIHDVKALDPDTVLRALAHHRERLVIVAHSAAGAIGMDGASRISIHRQAPVLIL